MVAQRRMWMEKKDQEEPNMKEKKNNRSQQPKENSCSITTIQLYELYTCADSQEKTLM